MKLKTYKVRHPVYNLYRDGEVVMRLHSVGGRLLPETSLSRNTWINGLSSGRIKFGGNNSISHFAVDNKSEVSNWTKNYKVTRVVKVIHEMEYKGYAE